jgi:hypothetical protein
MPTPPMPNPKSAARAVAVAAAAVLLASCAKDNFHPVYPVSGRVLVDGQPAADCLVFLHRTFDDDHPRRVSPFGTTDATGVFKINSYSVGDGAPEGEYIVTLEWRERSGLLGQNHDGPDKLDGAYANKDVNRNRPGFVIKVEKGPLELAPFEIKLTPEARRKADEIRKKAQAKAGMMGGDR